MLAIFEILLPLADKPSIRDKAKVNIGSIPNTHTWNLISGLAQIILNFANLNMVIFADYPESSVFSALYH